MNNTTPLPGRRVAIAVAVAAASIGGVAGAVLAGQASSNSSTIAANNAASTSTPTPAAGPFGRGGEHHGMHRRPVGTVTAISSSAHTLTLRTLLGSLTVTTSGSTTYSREGKSIGFGDIRVDDVVAVRGTPSGGSSTSPPTSIAATEVIVRMPGVMGRVDSISGDTITVVLRDGQLGTITTSGSTTYRNRDGSSASSTALKPGAFIAAQGARTGLKAITADVVTILPAPGTERGRNDSAAFPGMPGGPGGFLDGTDL